VKYDLLEWTSVPKSQQAPKAQLAKPATKSKPKKIPAQRVEQPVAEESAPARVLKFPAVKVEPPEPEPTPPPPEPEPTPPPLDQPPEFEVPEPTPTPAPTPVSTPIPHPTAKPQPTAPRQVQQTKPAVAPTAAPGLVKGSKTGSPDGTGNGGPRSGTLIRSPRPSYPPQALEMHITGEVRVAFTVQNGNIVDARAISGPPMLSSYVIRFCRENWKFSSNSNGTYTLPVSFQLAH
jgi:outer membrane biosynthesis protein TonB